MDDDAHKASVHQPPADQPAGVAQAPVRVKEPVLQYPEGGVVNPLVQLVVARRGVRRHLQHEFGRLALVANGVPLLGNDPGAPDVKGDEQIRDADFAAPPGNPPVKWNLAKHYGGLRVAQMQAQRGLVPVIVEVRCVHHIGTRRKVGELVQG